MKPKHHIIRLVCAVSAFALTAVAQDLGQNPTNASDTAGTSDESPGTNRVDNTARNVRDRDHRTLTPVDQGNNEADLATTAKIRKDILAMKNMSVAARNVKIITNQGKVTLRGPVNTLEEKRLIGEIANRNAGPENVDNQLDVKQTDVHP